MGYFFLALALIAGAAKGFCGKKISSRLGGYGDAALSNFIRMIICVAVGLVLALSQSGNFFAETSTCTILCALLSSVATASFIVSWVISIRKGAFVMVDVFLTLGVGITLLLSRIFLNEHIRANHIIGFIILAVAAYVMCSYSQKLSGKMTFSSLLLLILCGVSNGLADFSQKLFVHTTEGESAAVFNFYSYVFSSAVLLVAYFIFKKKEKGVESVFATSYAKKLLIYIAVMAVMLFVNSYFKTLAAGRLASALLYPLNQGSALILALFMGAAFFKEKITPRCLVGIAMAFAALFIINVL